MKGLKLLHVERRNKVSDREALEQVDGPGFVGASSGRDRRASLIVADLSREYSYTAEHCQ
jgi:hypothetical protein